jgi:hypothetical protein
LRTAVCLPVFKTVAQVTAAFRRSGISLQLREQLRLKPDSLLMLYTKCTATLSAANITFLPIILIYTFAFTEYFL